jgi:hypothetical protein
MTITTVAPSLETAVPRWAERVAHVIPLLTLPSGLWRLGLAFGSSMGTVDDYGRPLHLQGWEIPYVVGLSVFSELVALTAFGLIRPWGEVVPRWIPWIGGRPVPPYAAIVPAVLGSLALIAIWSYGFRDLFSRMPIPFANDGWAALMITCYLPLNLWGPLLLVLTWAYWRRRVPARSAVTPRPYEDGTRTIALGPHGTADDMCDDLSG